MVYLDHAASTPLRPEAMTAMAPFLTDGFANPSGMHAAARKAKSALEVAREQVAEICGAAPAEIVFTGGGSESDKRAVIHTDAVQGLPWTALAPVTSGADLVSISAHKFGGPKGVGALVVRDGVGLVPLVEGGGHEGERRAGTQNVAGIVGLAAAALAADKHRAAEGVRIAALRDRLEDGLAQ